MHCKRHKTLLDEMNLEYGELLIHMEVQSLSKGKILCHFYELWPAIVTFFKYKNENYLTLEDIAWFRDFTFLIDITEKFNKLNLYLRARIKIFCKFWKFYHLLVNLICGKLIIGKEI